MNLVINLCKEKLTRTKIDNMKKIVFSKLWKHNTYCKIGSICFQNKKFKRVCTNQEWGSHEKNLQRLKYIISFNSPIKRLILPSQLNKRGHYWRIVGNETLIKIGKSNKTLDILNKSWSSSMVWNLWRFMQMPSLEMT